MTTAAYPMTRVAANALVLALLMLAARALGYVAAFVSGWQFDIGLSLLVLLAGLATTVCLFGAAVFGFGLVVQTLRRRVHPRYVAALIAMGVLWAASFLLPPPYLSGMAWSLSVRGVDEKALVNFAAACRTLDPVTPSRVGRELRFGSAQLRPLQDSHRRVFDIVPRGARVFVADETVSIKWGSSTPGLYSLTVFDRGERSEATPVGQQSAGYRRITQRVFASQHHG